MTARIYKIGNDVNHRYEALYMTKIIFVSKSLELRSLFNVCSSNSLIIICMDNILYCLPCIFSQADVCVSMMIEDKNRSRFFTMSRITAQPSLCHML
jgi:hypothetical protein